MTVKDDISREFRRRLIADLLSTSLHRTMRVSLSFWSVRVSGTMFCTMLSNDCEFSGGIVERRARRRASWLVCFRDVPSKLDVSISRHFLCPCLSMVYAVLIDGKLCVILAGLVFGATSRVVDGQLWAVIKTGCHLRRKHNFLDSTIAWKGCSFQETEWPSSYWTAIIQRKRVCFSHIFVSKSTRTNCLVSVTVRSQVLHLV